MGLLDFNPYDTSGGVLPIPNNRVESAFGALSPNWDDPQWKEQPLTLQQLYQQYAQQQAQPQQPPQQPYQTASAGPIPQGGSVPPPGPNGVIPPSPAPQMAAGGGGGMPQGAPGIGDRLGAGLFGFANAGGPIQALAQMVGGLATGQRQDPFGIAQQNLHQTQAATYQALRQSGVPHGEAMAAALNPEVLKTISPNIYTKPKWGVISEDSFGGKKYGWIDEGKQTINGGRVGGAGGPSSGEPTDPNGDPLTGQAYLEYLKKNDPTAAAGVEGLLAGNITAGGRNLQKLIPAASRVDPGFDQNVFNQRKNLVTEYGKGTPNSLGGQRNAGNTAIGHLATLSGQALALNNVDLGGVAPDIAGIINWARQRGTTEQKTAANNLADTLDRYVTEVAKFYAGSSSGGVHEREAARQRFSSYKTPSELAGAIASERDLFQSKLQQLEDQANQVLGSPERRQKLVGDIVQPHAQEGLKTIEGNLARLRSGGGQNNSTPAPSAAKTATNPKTGQKIINRGDGKGWVPYIQQ